jgi:hypothetical protein
MYRLNKEYGLRYFFGTDDNFFNSKARAWTSSRRSPERSSTACHCGASARWYTEVTVHDTLMMKEHLPLVRKAGAGRCGWEWRT